jgi:hypothetical protein
MKSLFLILVMVLLAGFGYGVQPLRKPFIQFSIDGKPSKSGDILIVKPGQKFLIQAELEGGRRDYCKFPDTYADITGIAQILSRGENGLTYQLDGEKAEWKVIKEESHFTSDEFLQIKTPNNQSTTEITVSKNKFTQTFLNINFKILWQFTQKGKTTQEENTAEETVYFKVAGESDVWFSTQNIQASGIQNQLIEQKLKDVQSVCDSVETNFFRLDFTAVQQSIKNMQNVVNILKSTIDEVKASNPSYTTKVLFIGLPSDNPYSDISVLLAIKNSWTAQEALINDLKKQLGKLPAESTKESNDELMEIISNYIAWQTKLPENTFKVLPRYLPDLNSEIIQLPENIRSVAKEKAVPNYPQTIKDLNAFYDQRLQQIPDETQRISSTQARLQAVRLFDGMLRSYFSSQYWAEWKNTRE